MRRMILATGAAGLMAAAGFAAPAVAADGEAQLSVLHGVPDLTVDVWVDGALTLDDFAPGTLAGPLALPAGGYSLAITASDAGSADEAVIGPVDVELEGGGNYTAVANLDAEGNPTANFYTNDVSAIEAGKSKLTVRHTAAAPEVDILAGDTAVIEGLANPDEQTLTLDPGTVPAAVAAAGTTEPVIGPADVAVAEGTHTVVYAWGSLDDGNLQLAVQNIEGLHSNPGAVPGGRSGAAADDAGTGAAVAGGAAAGLLLLGAGTVVLRRRAEARRG
jgi:Domain of unknown function (DUF4397)